MPASAALPALRILQQARRDDAVDAYKNTVRDCIRAGGCCASRAAVAGAFVAATYGIESIPADWIAKLTNAHVLDDVFELVKKAEMASAASSSK